MSDMPGDRTAADEGGRLRLAGRYELLGSLGHGGMADVQRARDLELDREVAVKILHSRYASDDEFLARFQREARAAANLNHPNIVAVYDAGETGNRPYIVMELVDGRSLADVVRSDEVMPETAARIVGDAALALDYAHDRGLVHRDVKPANILISDDGQVKVTDFGIARAVGAETVTQTAAVFGTASYMAPEQARSEQVDRRTDVYALGCVLYELLAGRAPFTADSPIAVAHKHIAEVPPVPSTFAADIPEEFDAIAMKAMAKDPADRYQTARELHDDLQRALGGLAVTAPIAAAWAAAGGLGAAAATRAVDYPESPTEVVQAAPEEPEPEPNRSRRALGYTLLGLAVVAAVVALGWLLSVLAGPAEPQLVVVPNVVNQPLDDARRILEANDLDSDVAGREPSLDVPEDAVIRTDPQVGDEVEVGTEVQLTVSDGPPTVEVPAIVGLPEDDARAALRNAGLQVDERTTETSDDVPEGNVIRASPPPGTEVEVDSLVDLVVSSGTGAVAIPDVGGFSEARAVEELETFCDTDTPPCLRVTISRQFDPSVPQGVVIGQSPPAGTEVQPGSGVVIVVSRGPEPTPTTEPPPEPTPEPTPTPTPTPPTPAPT